ncbi:MAG: hypothetical protein ACP5RM_00720 [Candidatus Micrarchaeia archaeon]
MMIKHNAAVFLFAFLAAFVLLQNVSYGVTPALCNELFPGNSNILSGTSMQSILAISLLIMVVMTLITGIIYAIGYSFRIDKAVRFAKSELGEIGITVLLVLIFIGSFYIVSASTPNSLFVLGNGAIGNSMYISDCSLLYNTSFSFVSPIIKLLGTEIFVKAVASAKFTLAPVYFGIVMSPFEGTSVINNVLSMMIDMAGIFIGINIAALFIMVIAYNLFPLFFFAGIALRTIPFTRAAGGAFISLFIAFYLIFPAIINVSTMLYTSIPSTIPGYYYPSNSFSSYIGQFVSAFTENPVSLLSGFGAVINIFETFAQGIITLFIITVVEPAMFYVLSVVIAFIISFNFMEVLGDMLGSPSLRSDKTFKRLL